MTDIEWLAGFFDGEGCIVIVRRKPAKNFLHYLRLDIGNTHKSSIEKIHSILGCGTVNRSEGTNRPMWRWQATGNGAAKTLWLLLPYLVTKRKQAKLALDFQILQQFTRHEGGNKGLLIETVGQRDAYYWALRELK